VSSSSLHPDAVADLITAHSLLNCLIREVSGPEGEVCAAGEHVVIRLPRRGVVLRIPVRRACAIGGYRFSGPAEERRGDAWEVVGWHRLAACIEQELVQRSGVGNDEFLDHVASSRETIAVALRRRSAAPPADLDPYLASEQALVYGHRYHPTPKARSGRPDDWLAYAPEAGARFRLRYLALQRSLIREEATDPEALGLFDRIGASLRTPATPAGTYALLPAHPWQFSLLREHPQLSAALRDGRIVDLGEGGSPVVPTASVRTLWHPEARAFLKFSLNVRITNCVRKNAAYELTGAVALTRVLRPVAEELYKMFGTVVLAEPAYRTLDIGDPDLVEGFGVIVREGLGPHLDPGVSPLLAAAIADEYPTSPAQLSTLLRRTGDSADAALAWWDAYLGLLIPPVLHAYFHHGVVFEPHLQNVVVGVGEDGLPKQVFLRDMEGTKLLPASHAGALAGLPEDVRSQVTYDAQRGWNRVVYCLLVNHVAEMLAAMADRFPRLESELWARVAAALEAYGREHGSSPQLHALLSGVPLPAKTNLLTRWERKADRHATYVALPNPLANPLASPLAGSAPSAAVAEPREAAR